MRKVEELLLRVSWGRSRSSSTLFLLWSCSVLAQEHLTFHHPAMGTEFQIQVYATDSLHADRSVRRVFARIDRLEQSMSDYRYSSEINRLTGSTKWQRVSPDLWTVLRFSRRLARRSGGAFDPTIGPLSKLWRRAFRRQQFPAKEDISRARAQVQWKYLKLAGKDRIKLLRENIQLDLGGVAKGYALDLAGRLLREAGYPRFLLDGGGDLLLGQPPPGRAGWSVITPDGKTLGPLREVAIATSGATYRFLEHEGVRYSHLIDPRTGYGVEGQQIVTIIAPTGMAADGLASALSIEKNGRLLKQYGAQIVD